MESPLPFQGLAFPGTHTPMSLLHTNKGACPHRRHVDTCFTSPSFFIWVIEIF